MWGDHNNTIQNPYTNWEPFDQQQLIHDHHQHHHHDSFNVSVGEGSSNNPNLHLHPQGGSLIGLTLRKSNSLINLVETTLSQEREQKKVEKLKASNFPALLLQIGSWKRISRNEGDLIAKLYYAKKKLVWEFLDGPLKSKIEIQWSEISAIKAFICEGEHGRLEIELNQPPQFGREINPQPRKHTQWIQTTDFTGGQASICRRHSIIFPPRVLDKQYEKLLQCDNRLFSLSQQPFPVNNYPFFYHDPNHCLDYSNMDVYRQPFMHVQGDHVHGGQDHFLQCNVQKSWIMFSQSQMKTPHEEPGYENIGITSIDQLPVNSVIGIQEPNFRVSVPHTNELPFEHGMDDLESLYRNQQCYSSWM